MHGFGVWDAALLVMVTLQATVLSYVHHPKWKAFIWNLPIPFTLATLALGKPIDATNVVAVNVLVIYTHGVRLLYRRLHVPIALAIVIGALIYCTIGWMLAGVLPETDLAFWISAAATIALGILLFTLTSPRDEPGHRSPMPVWLKLPTIALVVLGLILIKDSLRGFMAFFPMVGVIAAYEARKSLWTICRQVPVLMMTTVPLLVACRLTQKRFGLGIGLMCGWVVFALILTPMTKRIFSEG